MVTFTYIFSAAETNTICHSQLNIRFNQVHILYENEQFCYCEMKVLYRWRIPDRTVDHNTAIEIVSQINLKVMPRISILGSSRLVIQSGTNFQYAHNLDICDNFKYLAFDCKLKWSTHCTLIVSKCKQRFFFLRLLNSCRVKNDILHIFYTSMIESIMLQHTFVVVINERE